VLQREALLGYQLRDRHGASRAVAYLMLAAAPYVFVTGIVTVPTPPVPVIVAVTLTCLAVAVAGVVCWARPRVMPDNFWLAAPFVAAILITGINLVTEDASTGAQLFNLWPVLYAASYLSRRVVYYNVAVVVAGDGAVNLLLQEPEKALADWSAMILAMVMTAVVVVALRDRADQLLRVLETQANSDALTGLANRRAFDDALNHAAARAGRHGDRLALLTVDVDRFKDINDSWGHGVGDRALRAVAAAMLSVATAEDDVVARLGGDEFVMLLRRDRPGALRAAEELRSAIAAIDVLPGGPPGVSIGVAVLPDDAGTVEALLMASDTALYDAKTRGRGRVATAGDNPPDRPDVDLPDRLDVDRATARRGEAVSAQEAVARS